MLAYASGRDGVTAGYTDRGSSRDEFVRLTPITKFAVAGTQRIRLCEAALTMQQGGGIGYDFPSIRPKSTAVKGVGTEAS